MRGRRKGRAGTMFRISLWIVSAVIGLSALAVGSGAPTATAGGYERRATTCTAACRQARIGAHHSDLKRRHVARGQFAYQQDYERPYQYLYRPGKGAIALSPSVIYPDRPVRARNKVRFPRRRPFTGCYRSYDGHILHCRTTAQRAPKVFKKSPK